MDFNEEGKSKSQSYPIEMNYTYYASHPDLIISGNGIYDKEYNLKRIITLRRNEIGWGQNIGTFHLNKDNGIYYIDDNLRTYGIHHSGISSINKFFKCFSRTYPSQLREKIQSYISFSSRLSNFLYMFSSSI